MHCVNHLYLFCLSHTNHYVWRVNGNKDREEYGKLNSLNLSMLILVIMIIVTLEASIGNTVNSTKVQRQKTSKNVMAVSKFQKS